MQWTNEENKEIITKKAHVLMYQQILKTLRKKNVKTKKTLREIDIASIVSLFVGKLFAVNVSSQMCDTIP